jgi:peptidoglycan/LPS O-acetylase OafA/YrhL
LWFRRIQSGKSCILERMGWTLGHRPALDGLRGVAILLVLCAHFDNPAANPLSGAGVTGVTLFFTLSGFLITALLLEERTRSGRVSLTGFYRRRAARLLPALFAMLVVVALVQASWEPLGIDRTEFESVLFYWSNWYQIAHPGIGALSHTWSLAVEEQFYVVWPLVMLLAARRGRRGITYAAVAGLVASVVAILTPGGAPVNRGSLEQAAALLAGCLLAVWMTGRPEGRPRPLVAALGLGVLVPLAVLHDTIPAATYQLAVPVAAVGILWSLAQGDTRWLTGPVLRWFGRRSYGIYLWHYPVLYIVGVNPDLPWWVRSEILLSVSLAVAEVSWRLIEHPAQRFGRTPAPRLVVAASSAA